MVDLRAEPPQGDRSPGIAGRDPRPWKRMETIEEAVLSSLSPFSSLTGIYQTLPPPPAPAPVALLPAPAAPAAPAAPRPAPVNPQDPRILLVRDEDQLKDYDREFPWLFDLPSITRMSRITVKWTDNLLDHLFVQTDPKDHFWKMVYVFDHSKWLRQIADPTAADPANQVPEFCKEAAKEALETLALLMPLDDEDISRYMNKHMRSRNLGGMWLGLQEDNEMKPKRRVQGYLIWRHKLLMLEEAFGSSSSTFWQLLRDRRDNNRWWNFCVAFLAFILAVLLLLFTVWLGVDTQKVLVAEEAKSADTKNPAPAAVTSSNSTLYYCCPAAAYCSATIAANFTTSMATSISPPESSAATILPNSTTLYPDTYSRYDIDTGALEYNVQYGQIQKGTGFNDTTTLLSFIFPNRTSGLKCQFTFWLDGNTTHTGSQEFDIFISNAQPFESTNSWPSSNLRNTYAGRMMFSDVPGFAEFEAGYMNVAQQFPCPGGQKASYELVGVNDEDSILWNKTSSGPYIVVSQGD